MEKKKKQIHILAMKILSKDYKRQKYNAAYPENPMSLKPDIPE